MLNALGCFHTTAHTQHLWNACVRLVMSAKANMSKASASKKVNIFNFSGRGVQSLWAPYCQ